MICLDYLRLRDFFETYKIKLYIIYLISENMGTDYSKLPPSVEAMTPTSKTPNVEIEYCAA